MSTVPTILKFHDLIIEIDDDKDNLLIKLEDGNPVEFDFFEESEKVYYNRYKRTKGTSYYGIIDIEEDLGCAIEEDDLDSITFYNNLISFANKKLIDNLDYFVKIKKECNEKLYSFIKENGMKEGAELESFKTYCNEDLNKKLSKLQK